MKGNIQIARIFGIPITINYSWIVIFLLLTWALAFFYFPLTYPALSRATQILMGVVTSILFFGSVVFHELLHSIVARHYGLPIEAINLWIFGGVSRLSEEPRTPGIEFRMSIAGPLSSFFLAGAFALITYFGTLLRAPAIIGVAFYLAFINAFLGAFNLLPGFPLDGGRVLRSVVWYFTGDFWRATRVATIGGRIIAYLMILLGFVAVFSGVFTGLWLIFLGWFLLQAAAASYEQMVLKQALEGLTVGEAMTGNPATVREDLSLLELVTGYFKRYRWSAFPVVDEADTLLGLVTIRGIRKIPRERWDGLVVKQVMIPLSDEIVVSPDDDIYRILPKLENKSGGRLLVTEDGHLAGIITREDVTRALRTRMELER
ncbi:MAG: site-2 protease family protein [Actinobacteria bacterium]|nr:site-2 protease family protein [Actinomycetota bacterium]